MKKTIIALMVLSGMAFASIPDNTTVITFSTGGALAGDYVYGVNFGTASLNTHAKNKVSYTEDNVTMTLTAGGSLYTTYTVNENPNATTLNTLWTNSTALAEMNSTLGTSLTLTNLDALPMTNAGKYSGDLCTMTLDFSNVYAANDSCTFYVMVSTLEGGGHGLTIAGLNAGYTVQLATATGTGFSTISPTSTGGSTYAYGDQTARHLNLYKISGQLSEGAVVTLGGTGGKNAFGLVAYNIPEPATATLSLLALCGLAARRRRV